MKFILFNEANIIYLYTNYINHTYINYASLHSEWITGFICLT